MRGRPTQLKPSERLCGDFDYITRRNELIPRAKAEATKHMNTRKHMSGNKWQRTACFHSAMNRLAFEEGLTSWKA